MNKKTMVAIGIGALAVSLNAAEANAMEKGTISASALNIRSGPSIKNSKLGKVYKGQTVEILEKSQGWYKIKASNGLVGWGSSEYINIGSSNENNSTCVSTGNAKIKASALNIRLGAGISHAIVGKVLNGEVVSLLEESNGWYKVKLKNGITGWASGKYIVKVDQQSTGNSESQQTETFQDKRGKVISNSRLNVRSGPGTNYPVQCSISPGSVVELKEKSNSWYKVKLSNGLSGWATGRYISETTEPLTSNNQSNQENNPSKNPVVDKNNTNNNSNTNNNTNNNPTGSVNGSEIVNYAYTLMGKPYKWGASGPDIFDCSGFTQYVYRNAANKSIPRVSREQARAGQLVDRGNYKAGDLLYFDTNGDGAVNHVGIYIGGNEFIHCSGTISRPDKVKITSLSSAYWSKAVLGARRF